MATLQPDGLLAQQILEDVDKMSTYSKANTKSNNNNSCTRVVDGSVCITLSIVNINGFPPDESFDLISSGGPDITNQNSNKPLKSNGQTALENALTQELGDALAGYIRGMWNNYFFQNGQSFKVCADFAGTIDAESGGGATANLSLGNVDIAPQ